MFDIFETRREALSILLSLKLALKTFTMKKILFLSLILFTFIGCEMGVTGNGNVVKRSISVSDFNQLEVNGAFHTMIRQGDEPSLEVEMDENLFQYIEIEQEAGELTIETERPIRKSKARNLYLTVVNLEDIQVNGANEVETRGGLKGNSLSIQANGASELKIEYEGSRLTMEANGGSEINLRGSVDDLGIEVTGAAEVRAFEMRASSVKVGVSGAAETDVWAIDQLSVSASGASDVRFKGNPKINKSTSGASTISPYSKDEE